VRHKILFYTILGLTFLSLIIPAMGQTANSPYDREIFNNFMRVGIKTNAPDNVDALSYTYQEEMKISIDVYSVEYPNQIATKIRLQLRSSSLGDRSELLINVSTIQLLKQFHAELSAISYHQLNSTEKLINTTKVFHFTKSNTTSQLQLQLSGAYTQQLIPLQVIPAIKINFSSFQPVTYETGSLAMSTWDQITNVITTDTVILPIVAIGAAVHIWSQGQATALSEATSDSVEALKDEFAETTDDIETTVGDLKDEHEEVINATRKVKEGTDFTKDAVEVKGELSKEYETNWIHGWTKFMLFIYFLLLLAVTARLFYQYPADLDQLLIRSYTVYSTFFLSCLLLFTVVSFLKPSVLGSIGESLPRLHLFFALLGIAIFIAVPLLQLLDLLTAENLSGITDVLFISLISFGFVITTIFAGYYLSRAGISWNGLVQSILKKIHFSTGWRKLIGRILTLAFFVLVSFRLFKTVALAIVLFSTGQLAKNAYLVSLAASYLDQEGTGSIWIVYGLILIFFIQTIMAIFLQLKKNHLPEDDSYPDVFRFYRRFALLLLISVISFIHLVLILQGKIDELGINKLVYPGQPLNSIDVFNELFVVPPFKILLDLVLAMGLLISLPWSIHEMWVRSTDEEQK